MALTQTLFVISPEGVTPVERLAQSHKAFNEAWVRDLLFYNPGVLPIEDILSDGGSFLPIATEVPLNKAGVADLIGITTGGYPVVVETKLWKNPQARREVLAQTIDYVKELSKSGYDFFERLWGRRKDTPAGQFLFEAAAVLDEELDEAQFIDRVGRACQRGDILGFIVGDGIQHGLVELVDHLTRDSAHLRYSIALLELRCFPLGNGDLAVLPNIVSEIIPVERAYIQIEPSEALAEQLKVMSISRPLPPPQPGKRITLTEDQFWQAFSVAAGAEMGNRFRRFVDELREDSGGSPRLEPEYKQRALMLKVPDPDEVKAGASVFAITCDGRAYNTRYGLNQATKWGIPQARVEEIRNAYYRRLHDICPGFTVEGTHQLNPSHFVPVADFADRLDDVAREIKGVASELQAASQDR